MEHFLRKKFTNFAFMRKKKLYSYFVKDDYEAILNKLRLLRKEKGFTQHQIGERIGLTSTAYSKLENGHIKLDLERFLIILKILDTSLKDFFKEI